MLVRSSCLGIGAAIGMAASPGVSVARTADASSLMAMDTSGLRDEMRSRYDDALALSQDQSVVGADSTRYMWATQAKVQCGIALGYLKSGFKDAVSVGKCVDSHLRMQSAPPSPPAAPEPPQLCRQPVAGIVYFDWNSAVPPADASSTVDSVVTNKGVCNWASVSVVGHADRSGSDAYNEVLAERRARAVADLLQAKGVTVDRVVVSSMGERQNRTPTDDGVREPQNRRVEVTVD